MTALVIGRSVVAQIVARTPTGFLSYARGLVLAFLVGTVAMSTAPASAAPSDGDVREAVTVAPAATTSAQTKREAKQFIGKARAAAREGDYATAVELFEHALVLRPSAAVHYNIAVCHHRMMLQAEDDSPAQETARAAAVRAYNHYLKAAKSAPDRYEIARTITELGGRPALLDTWRIDAGSPNTVAEPQLRDEDPGPDSEPTPSETPADSHTDLSRANSTDTQNNTDTKSPRAPRGSVGFSFGLGLTAIGKLAQTSEVETLPVLGGTFRVGGYLGPRKRVLLGGELGFGVQPSAAKQRHRLQQSYLGGFAEFVAVLGSQQRLLLGAGGVLAIGSNTLVHRVASTATCPTQSKGGISSRGGLLAVARANIGVLLGANKRHELSLRVGPGLGLFGGASKGKDDADICDAATSPFAEFGITKTNLVVLADFGYAIRF